MSAGRVLRFWWLPEEERKFIDFLEKTGQVVAYPGGAFWTKEELSPKPIRKYIEENAPDQLKLSILGAFPEPVIISTGRTSEPHLHISYSRSCIIVYDRVRFKSEDTLAAGNLCANTYYVIDEKWAEKPIEFTKWVDRVFRWVRRATSEKYGKYNYRVSKRVMEAIQKGLKLTEY